MSWAAVYYTLATIIAFQSMIIAFLSMALVAVFLWPHKVEQFNEWRVALVARLKSRGIA